jgi:hypothetical protein
MTAIRWTKTGEDSTARVGPFVMKLTPKGDGRWVWTIWRGETANPAATGVGSSAGAARTAAENYVNRSGLLP